MKVMQRICASVLWVDAGITTQEYAPVLPQNTNGIGNNQLESNGYANTHEARGRYMDGSDAYDQEDQRGVGGYNPQGGTDGLGYSHGVNSYNSAGRDRANKYSQQAGGLSLLQLYAQFHSSALDISCHARVLHQVASEQEGPSICIQTSLSEQLHLSICHPAVSTSHQDII